MDLNYLLVSN